MQAVIYATPKLEGGMVSPKALVEVCGMVAAGLFVSTVERPDDKEVALAAEAMVSAFTSARHAAEIGLAVSRPLH